MAASSCLPRLLHLLLFLSPALARDWLVDDVATPATARPWPAPPIADDTLHRLHDRFAAVELGNSLVSRIFSTSPNWATIDYRSYLDDADTGESMLRAVTPEARIDISCGGGHRERYDIGGLLVANPLQDPFLNRTALLNATSNASAFQYVSHRTQAPSKPYEWTPGNRHSSPDAAWPPAGVVLVASFEAPRSANVSSAVREARFQVDLHYQLYQGLPLLAKTLHVTRGNPRSQCRVVFTEVEVLAVNHPFSPVPMVAYAAQGLTHYYEAPPRLAQFDGSGKLRVEVTQQYSTAVRWVDETAPTTTTTTGGAGYGATATATTTTATATTTTTTTTTTRGPSGSHAARLTAALSSSFSSSLTGSNLGGPADIGATEPLLVVSHNGTRDEASPSTTTVLLLVLDDGPEQGAPMPLFPASQNVGGCTLGPCTLGDGAAALGAFNERQGLARRRMWTTVAPQGTENPVFMHLTDSSSAGLRAAVRQTSEAGFDMIIFSFGSGFDVESRDPEYVARIKADIAYANSMGIQVGGYDLIGWTRNPGGLNASWSCLDPATKKVTGNAFWGKGWSENLTNQVLWFAGETGLQMVETDGPYAGYACHSDDPVGDPGTVDAQFRNQARFFEALQSAGLYINAPDFYFAQGTSREGIGYNENTFSMPRRMQNVIARATIYDNTFVTPPTMAWSFVPLVDYHAGGSAAAFDPMSKHLADYANVLAANFGSGLSACWRGFRLWDDDASRALVLKWVGWFRKYRAILTLGDLIHIRRPDGQQVDGFVHVDRPRAAAAAAAAGGLRAVGVFFNPLDVATTTTVNVPLYYAGKRPGDTVVCSQEGDSREEPLRVVHDDDQDEEQQQKKRPLLLGAAAAGPLLAAGSPPPLLSSSSSSKVVLDARSRAKVTFEVQANSPTWITCSDYSAA